MSVEVAMYSILIFTVTAKVIDFFIKGFEDFIGLIDCLQNESLNLRNTQAKNGKW